eukprot:scaffold40574_cov27-Tisochrysis_lutea.AAC.15
MRNSAKVRSPERSASYLLSTACASGTSENMSDMKASRSSRALILPDLSRSNLSKAARKAA